MIYKIFPPAATLVVSFSTSNLFFSEVTNKAENKTEVAKTKKKHL
jgi:hypothetical protein